jgi:hypothetical protein
MYAACMHGVMWMHDACKEFFFDEKCKEFKLEEEDR